MKARIFAIALAISILIVGTIPIYADVMTGTEVIIGSDLYNDATTLGYIVSNLMNGNGFDFGAFTGTSIDFLADVGNAILGSDILRNYIDYVTDDLFGNTETITQMHTFGYHNINKDILDTVNMSFSGEASFDAETIELIRNVYDYRTVTWSGVTPLFASQNNSDIYNQSAYWLPMASYSDNTWSCGGVNAPYSIFIDMTQGKYRFFSGDNLNGAEFTTFSQSQLPSWPYPNHFHYDLRVSMFNGYLHYKLSYSNSSHSEDLQTFVSLYPFTDLKQALVNLIGCKPSKVYYGTSVEDAVLLTVPSVIGVGGGANLVYPNGSKQLVWTVPHGSRFDYDLLKQIIDDAINNHDELTIDDIMSIFVDVDGQPVLPVLVIVRNDFDNLINEQYGDNQIIVPFNYISDVLVGSEPMVVLMNDTSEVIPIEVVQMLIGGGAMVLLFVVLRRMGD